MKDSVMDKEDLILPQQNLPHESEATLEHSLSVLRALMPLLIRSGVGYNEFSTALKALFYNGAIDELDRIKQKKTDSSISLLAGLSRRDVSEFRQEKGDYNIINIESVSLPISVPARVVGLWIGSDLPNQIPINGPKNSFESLVKQISTEKHRKSILLELKRIGLVRIENETVVLLKESFTPSSDVDESKQLFTENICAHLSAGIHNLLENDDRFLEQAIFADELTTKSINRLKKLSIDLWEKTSKEVLSEAILCCKEDEGRDDAKHQFRLGIYDYTDDTK